MNFDESSTTDDLNGLQILSMLLNPHTFREGKELASKLKQAALRDETGTVGLEEQALIAGIKALTKTK